MAEINPISQELQSLINNKESGYNYRRRRQEEWLENYTLYRDKVRVNRLTQRQSVNIPLMKQTIRTLLKDVDDMPVLFYENLDNDKEKEVFLNEFWKIVSIENRFELQDIVDKRQVFLYGRSFSQMQVIDGKVKLTIQDPQDILVDRYMDPTDLHSSRFLIHTHIYLPLSDLEKNPDYDQKKVKALKKWYSTRMGLIKVAENQKMAAEKNRKLQDMGVPDIHDPVLGEATVELALHFVHDTREDSEDEELFLKVEVDDRQIIMNKPLEEIIGKTKDNWWQNHFPYETWADDLERQDFWSDGIADMVRTPNKVLNSFFSQLIENRTLRNYGMHYYDSTVESFQPQSFQPVPWGWYGLPGKPSEILQKVDIPDLSESIDEMEYITKVIEKASGATATQQGAQVERQITLGEVKLALGEAKERIKGMSKFYTQAWKDRGQAFLKLIEASASQIDAVTVYKKGRITSDIFQKEIEPNDWMTKSGYVTRVWSMDEKKTENAESIEKLNAVMVIMPDNPKLKEVFSRKMLEFADLEPEEINDIMELEKQKADMINSMAGQDQQPVPDTIPAPPIQALPAPTPKKSKGKKKGKAVGKLKSLRSQINA